MTGGLGIDVDVGVGVGMGVGIGIGVAGAAAAAMGRGDGGAVVRLIVGLVTGRVGPPRCPDVGLDRCRGDGPLQTGPAGTL